MKNLLFFLGMLVVAHVHAQDTTKHAVPSAVEKKDSVKPERRKSEIYKEPFKHVRRKFDSTLFTASPEPTSSDYAEDLEHLFQLLNKVPVVTESFTRLPEIDNALDAEDSALNILKERMAAPQN